MSDTECHFCGSTDCCKHLFAVIDRTNGTLEGGYLFLTADVIRAALLDRVRVLLTTSRVSVQQPGRVSYGFEKFFPEVRYLGPDVTNGELLESLDDYQYLDFLDEVLDSIDRVQSESGAVDCGRPGASFLERVYYAEDCALVVALAVMKVRTWDF